MALLHEEKMKPKENKGYNTGTYDECQTPPYALEPLYPYLNIKQKIWECAVGKGTLAIELGRKGYYVIFSGLEFNFLQVIRPVGDLILTNPPYSIKYEWLEHCYELNNPFALLMPVEMLGTARGQKLFNKYGIEVIFMSPRVDFYMPNKGYEGAGAQFPTAWFTWKLNLPKQINFATLNKPKRSELKEYWERAFGQ